MYSCKALWTAGSNLRKPRGSLERFTPKGYVLFLGVDFESDGAESIEGERGGGWPAGTGVLAAAPWPARPNLAGDGGYGTTEHHFPNREHSGKEEHEASSFPNSARLGK